MAITSDTLTKATQQAQEFLTACQKYGFTPVVKNPSVISITKAFQPNDKEAFTTCDMDSYGILALAPLKGGSVWGTDGGSVGGHSALIHGQYTLNKSGEGKRFMSALQKLLAK